MVSDGAFIFHIYILWDKALISVPESRSSVKVKYQGPSFRKIGCCGGFCVSQRHLVSHCFYVNIILLLLCKYSVRSVFTNSLYASNSHLKSQ